MVADRKPRMRAFRSVCNEAGTPWCNRQIKRALGGFACVLGLRGRGLFGTLRARLDTNGVEIFGTNGIDYFHPLGSGAQHR